MHAKLMSSLKRGGETPSSTPALAGASHCEAATATSLDQKVSFPPLSLHTRTQHTHTRHARTPTPPAACCLPDSAPVFTYPLACPPILPSACQHASPQAIAKHPPHSPLPYMYPLPLTQQEGTTTPRAAAAAGRPPRTRRPPRTSLQVTPSPPPRS